MAMDGENVHFGRVDLEHSSSNSFWHLGVLLTDWLHSEHGFQKLYHTCAKIRLAKNVCTTNINQTIRICLYFSGCVAIESERNMSI